MRARVAFALLSLSAGVAGAQMTPQQAAQQAKQVPMPDYKSVITPSSATNVVPQYGGDVSSQSGQFQGGKGDANPAGVTRIADCANKKDPECLAVELVAGGKANRPAVDPNAINSLVDTRNTIVGDMKNILGPNGGGMVDENNSCKNITRIEPPLFDTEVCDIKVPTVDTTCSVGWDVQVDPDYVYKCLQRINVTETQTCSVGRQIVVDATTLYKCIEQFQVENGAACTVGRVINVDVDYNYQCDVRPNKLTTYTCNKTLNVVGQPGCNQGQLYTAFASDPGGLGQDPCDGGDNLWLSYVCNPGAPPTLYIETNTKNFGNYGFWLNTWSWDQEHYFQNCKGRFFGNTSCANNLCTTSIVMEVSYASAGCVAWDGFGNCIQFGTVWVPSGALGKVFNYQSWSLVNVDDQWTNSCTALEARQ